MGEECSRVCGVLPEMRARGRDRNKPPHSLREVSSARRHTERWTAVRAPPSPMPTLHLCVHSIQSHYRYHSYTHCTTTMLSTSA